MPSLGATPRAAAPRGGRTTYAAARRPGGVRSRPAGAPLCAHREEEVLSRPATPRVRDVGGAKHVIEPVPRR
eukprot:scaffold942_cov366-Prasinococcus_capsulatus_cf.AAC.8